MDEKAQIIECHGKIEDAPTTLEQVWGFNEMAKYGTLNDDVYRQQIDEMGRTDLEAHARKIGVVIVESTSRLRENLFTEFRRYKSFLRKPVSGTKPTNAKDIPEDVRKILAEGR